MSELPKGWSKVNLNDIAEVITGNTPSKNDKENYGGKYAYFKPADLDFGYKVKTSRDSLSEIGIKKARFIPAYSTLVTCIGATIGKTGYSLVDGSCNQQINALVPDSLVENSWLYHMVCAPQLKNTIIENSSSTTLPIINKSKFSKLSLSLAPIAEQKRIVEKLDSLLAQVDTIQQRLNTLPNIIKRFRQSVLAAAVSGKLTEQWREDNIEGTSLEDAYKIYANELIANASTKSLQTRLKALHSETELNDFIPPVPQTWLVKNLNKVASGFSYGSSTKSDDEGKVPVLRMGNLQAGKLDWNKLVYTSDDEEISKYRLVYGDVLFNRTNSPELVGKTSIYRGGKEAIYAGYLIKVQGTSFINSEYINIVLNSPIAKKYCWQVKTDGVSQSNINAQKLGCFPCPICTIEEQTEIVRLVEQYFALADTLEKHQKNAKQRVDNLTQAILAKAFKGELVPQDPSDEPAEQLLARIFNARKEAEALAKAAKKAAGSNKRPTKTAKA